MKIRQPIRWATTPKYSQLRFIVPVKTNDILLREPWFERMLTLGEQAGSVRVSFVFTPEEMDRMFEFNRTHEALRD